MNLKRISKDINVLAEVAGEIILDYYNSDNIDKEYKSDMTPVTKADIEANKYIIEGLNSLYPNIPVLSEELYDDMKRLESSHVFIVDPLDGTKDFISKTGDFTVNIALVENGKPIVGVVYSPVEGKHYYAIKGEGAYKCSNGYANRIMANNIKDSLTIVDSRFHTSKKIEELIINNKNKISRQLKAGSSIKGCLIAEGQAELYYRFGPIREWDIAAMAIIIEESGAIIRSMIDEELKFNQADTLINTGFYVINHRENRLR